VDFEDQTHKSTSSAGFLGWKGCTRQGLDGHESKAALQLGAWGGGCENCTASRFVVMHGRSASSGMNSFRWKRGKAVIPNVGMEMSRSCRNHLWFGFAAADRMDRSNPGRFHS